MIQNDVFYLLYFVCLFRYFKAGTLLANYGDVLAILLRLRQLCCHPSLIAAAAALMAQKGTFFLLYFCFCFCFLFFDKHLES